MLHALVTPIEYFNKVIDKIIVADLKKDDRPYQEGDTVLLQEFDDKKRIYTGRELPLNLLRVVRNAPREGLRAGFVFITFSAGDVKQNQLPAGYGEDAAILTETEKGDGGPIITDQNAV